MGLYTRFFLPIAKIKQTLFVTSIPDKYVKKTWAYYTHGFCCPFSECPVWVFHLTIKVYRSTRVGFSFLEGKISGNFPPL